LQEFRSYRISRASHRGHEGHRGGIGRGRDFYPLPGISLAWLRESREGESIAQRSRRTQRGIGRGRLLPGTPLAWLQNHAKGEEHRTEVTEDTEGDRKGERLLPFTGDIAGLAARITRRGKHRTEVTEDTEDRSWWDETSAAGTVGLGARITRKEEGNPRRARRQ
jgi:hypothetical protein